MNTTYLYLWILTQRGIQIGSVKKQDFDLDSFFGSWNWREKFQG